VKVPPELFTEWLNEAMEKTSLNAKPGTVAAIMADKAAQWGADQELMVCMDAIYLHEGRPLCGGTAEWLRATRRPKPPSLAERALEQYERVEDILLNHDVILAGCIRTALTRLAELEAQQ
jgi:hypothetical protein